MASSCARNCNSGYIETQNLALCKQPGGSNPPSSTMHLTDWLRLSRRKVEFTHEACPC
jgi:hypothetical protein